MYTRERTRLNTANAFNMETIKISAEDKEFLRDLQRELNTQETDWQADPIFWGVMETHKVAAPDGSGEARAYLPVFGSDVSIEELIKEINDMDGKNDDYWDEVDKTDIDEVVDFYNGLVDQCEQAYVVWVGEEEVLSRNTGAFLTKRACKEYIERFGYNHNKPHTYAMTAFRNFEYERLLKILKTMQLD